MFEELLHWPAPVTEDWLRTFLEQGKIRRTRAMAGLLLAVYKRSLAEQAGVGPSPDWIKTMRSRFGEHAVDYVAKLDPRALRAEAAALLERVIADYSDVELGGGTTIGAVAKPTLFEWTQLAIGHEVPEIEGTDLSGLPLKLSEYRGRVVMLSFWASWCDPCMRLVPHERELVKRYQGKPFALLGINDDDSLEHAQHAAERMQMTWRSWRKVRKGPSLREQWNVNGIPTVYIVDKAGIIRGKQLFGEELQALLDALVDE
jgi:thiol-disulfide isomerase/thioredoxin